MPGSARFRLAFLMFLQYAALGAWCVTWPTFLKAGPHDGGLNLTGRQIGWLYATFAFAAALAPLIAGILANRFLATQNLLAILHLFAGILLVLIFRTCREHQEQLELNFRKHAFLERAGSEELWRSIWERDSLRAFLRSPATYRRPPKAYPPAVTRWLDWFQIGRARLGDVSFPLHVATVDEASQRLREIDWLIAPVLQQIRRYPEMAGESEHAFHSLFWLLFAYNLCYLPTTSLANVLCLRNVPAPDRQFGPIRLFGTVGWIAALVFVGWSLPDVSAMPLLVAAVLSIGLAGFCLVQPHTPPLARTSRMGDWFGISALRMLSDRSFRVFLVAAFWGSLFIAFHNVFANPFLADLQLEHAAAFQAISQATEVGGILLIPLVRRQFGMHGLLTLGLLASAFRFFGYAAGAIPIALVVGLPLHGIAYSWFFIAAAIYVDARAPGHLRASAQGLLTQATSGLGALGGTLLSGAMVDRFTTASGVDWPRLWLIPAIGTLIAAGAFGLFFRDRALKIE